MSGTEYRLWRLLKPPVCARNCNFFVEITVSLPCVRPMNYCIQLLKSWNDDHIPCYLYQGMGGILCNVAMSCREGKTVPCAEHKRTMNKCTEGSQVQAAILKAEHILQDKVHREALSGLVACGPRSVPCSWNLSPERVSVTITGSSLNTEYRV